LKRVGNGIAHLFYPMHCMGCNTELVGTEHTLCPHCIMALPITGFESHLENLAYQRFTGRTPIEKVTSFVYFSKHGLVQHLMHQFKYKNKIEIGVLFGYLLAENFKIYNWLDTIDAIVTVPLHKNKIARRGFNQSDAFAEGISAVSGKPLQKGVLKRIRDTESQTNKTRAERIENMSGAFDLLRPEQIEGKHLLLIDDVLTTGATLEACAIRLLEEKNVKVSIATIAIATD